MSLFEIICRNVLLIDFKNVEFYIYTAFFRNCLLDFPIATNTRFWRAFPNPVLCVFTWTWKPIIISFLGRYEIYRDNLMKLGWHAKTGHDMTRHSHVMSCHDTVHTKGRNLLWPGTAWHHAAETWTTWHGKVCDHNKQTWHGTAWHGAIPGVGILRIMTNRNALQMLCQSGSTANLAIW